MPNSNKAIYLLKWRWTEPENHSDPDRSELINVYQNETEAITAYYNELSHSERLAVPVDIYIVKATYEQLHKAFNDDSTTPLTGKKEKRSAHVSK